MLKRIASVISLDFFCKTFIIAFAFLQAVRWPLIPQFIDSYYHLQTAWGFVFAGGYSGWDFWQYAPVGRPHIYPPLFHLALALLLKSGANPIIFIKFFEITLPVVFLIIFWRLLRKYFGPQLAFWAMVSFGSTYPFYLSLLNYIPASLALIFGLWAIGRLLEARVIPAAILFSLAFYTHIGIPWFILLGVFIYGLLDSTHRRACFETAGLALIFSSPMLFKEALCLKHISSLGFNLNEAFNLKIKIIECLSALFALAILARDKEIRKKYLLILSLFFSSFIFLFYPGRFFSGQGLFAIVLLSALGLTIFFQRYTGGNKRPLQILTVIIFLVFSPSVWTVKAPAERRVSLSLKLFDTTLMGMILPKAGTLWFPSEYSSAVRIIKDNSTRSDIIVSDMAISAVILAGLSGRMTSAALLPEIGPRYMFDPLSSARIIVVNRGENQFCWQDAAKREGFQELGRNKMFIVFRNPHCTMQANIVKASLPFWLCLVFLLPAAVFVFIL